MVKYSDLEEVNALSEEINDITNALSRNIYAFNIQALSQKEAQSESLDDIPLSEGWLRVEQSELFDKIKQIYINHLNDKLKSVKQDLSELGVEVDA
jgi:hypothetical protein